MTTPALPPFELVRLIPSAFHPLHQVNSPATGPPHASISSPPSASGTGVTSPERVGSPSQHLNQSTVGDRLSQLINPARPSSPQAGATSPPGVTSPSAQTPFGPSSRGILQQAASIASSSSTSRPTIRCAEAGNETVYVAGNEGSVAIWRLDPASIQSRNKDKGKQRASEEEDKPVSDQQAGSDSGNNAADYSIASAEEATYMLDQFNVVPNRRPIEKLAVLTTVGKAVILSEGVLTLHTLPTFAPLQGFLPIRGVSTFAINQSQNITPGHVSIPVCVIKRKSIHVFKVSQFTIEHLRDLPMKTSGILAVLNRNMIMCIADAINYSIIDLNEAVLIPLLPISQDPPDETAVGANDSNISIDLGHNTDMPPAAKPKLHQKPLILSVDKDEFLIASHTGSSTLGLFVKENGEPTRGTLEWASNPKSIVIEQSYVMALLQNNTLEIHNLHTQELVQVLNLAAVSLSTDTTQLPLSPTPASLSSQMTSSPHIGIQSFQPRLLASCCAGFPSRRSYNTHSGGDEGGSISPLIVPKVGSVNSLERKNIRLTPVPNLLDRENEESKEEEQPQASLSLEPPVTPRKDRISNRSALTATRPTKPSDTSSAPSTVVIVSSSTLIIGKESILALCPLTLLAQAENLFAKHKIEEALGLSEAIGPLNTADKIQEARYIQQKAAWSYLFETNFKDAGPLFSKGKTDPRLLISLYTDLKGTWFDSILSTSGKSVTIPIYKGLCSLLGNEILKVTSISEIISSNLVRNYSPHLTPQSPSVTDLQGKLERSAKDMLRIFLSEWRRIRRSGADLKELGLVGQDDVIRDLDKLVDTVLVKLYLQSPRQHLPLLIKMLEQEAHDIDVDEVAELLEKNGLHWFLSQLYLLRGRVGDTLVIWSELVDGVRKDERFSDGVTKIFGLLENSTNLDYVTKYGLWLVQKDPKLGSQILTKPAQGVQLDVDYVLPQLRDIDISVADYFLETTVFTRRNVDAKYHNELLDRYIARLELLLQATDLKERLRDSRSEYAEKAVTTEESIISFVLSQGNVATSETLSLRGKLVVLLYASLLYDVQAIRIKLENIEEMYFERALVYGKLGMHSEVLTILASTLQDMVSAEAYCAYAGTGDVLAPKNIREILEKLQIPHPSALLRKDGKRRQGQLGTNTQSNVIALLPTTEREDKRRELLNLLIKISLEQSSRKSATTRAQARSAHIIETQAIRISAKEIIPSIPNEWRLNLMESFLIRSMRRSLHEKHEIKLMKALLQERAMETSLRHYELTEALGGTLAEEEDDGSDNENLGDDDESPEKIVYLEKDGLQNSEDEKAVDLL